VRGRLVLAALAVVTVAAVLAWGLYPSQGNSPASKIADSRPPSPTAVSSAATPNSTPSTSAVAAPYAAAPAIPDVSKMRLVFNATFDGSGLNRSIWDTCFPWFADQAAGCTNFGDQEADWYLPSQVQVSGGELHLIAQPLATPGFNQSGSSETYNCRSGMVTTYPGFSFQYGYIQIVAQAAGGQDLWSAFWLAATDLKWPPEIDVIENWAPPLDTANMFFHPIGANVVGMHVPSPDVLPSGWHVYSLNWTPSGITWFLDGREFFAVQQNIPAQPMYFLANLARYTVGADDAPCNGTLNIQSVKVWQP
jgi:beta-glucanase (GH16 family)